MNFIFLSPHFPSNYYLFCVNLMKLGVNVLGLADQPYNTLHQDIKSALAEYYRVDNMHDYSGLLRASGYFTHRYGKIDRIDSHNEYWLESEARLRTDFNIFGLKISDLDKVKRKSVMKRVFKKAGIDTAQGKIIRTKKEALKLIDKIGFPVVVKPDVGVGAAMTHKINSLPELSKFFEQKSDANYLMEEFIDGTIISFDGLTDRNGNIVFYTSHQYSNGVMETVNEDTHTYYYSLRNIPSDLEEIGRKVVKAFDVRERFFHFEFFRQADNQIVALEVNMRPPGGLTTDMFNYANDIDIYREWANVVVNNSFESNYDRKYHCCYISRKFNNTYAHSHDEIMVKFKDKLVHHESINGVFSAALGDYGYLVRSPHLDEIKYMANFIHEIA